MLAPCCASLLGIDIVEYPLQAARARCADQKQVRFERMRAPMQWPGGRFDLIILSEVLYFLSPDDIARCARQVGGSVLPGAIVLLVNWLGQSDDPCSGDQAAERFIFETSAARTSAALTVARQDRSARYRLDLLVAP
jgi:hypothetical protein